MRGFNNAIIMGNVSKEPELRHSTNTNRPYAFFSVACNYNWKDPSGVLKESVDFIPIIVWGALAEFCARNIKKGSGVLVNGRIQSNNFEKDGVKRTSVNVLATSIQFVGTPPKSVMDAKEAAAKGGVTPTATTAKTGDDSSDGDVPF